MSNRNIKVIRSRRRIIRVRKKVSGTLERPRLSVSRSHRHIEAQIVDDLAGRTLCSASTRSKGVNIGYGGNRKAAVEIGKTIAEKARGLGIVTVCFDRRGRKYHGRLKALADAAREVGLKF